MGCILLYDDQCSLLNKLCKEKKQANMGDWKNKGEEDNLCILSAPSTKALMENDFI